MNIFQKTVSGVIIFGTALVVGSWVWIGTGEPAPESITFNIEDNCKIVETLRITPSHRMKYFPESSFTLNDLSSEIEFELRTVGEGERYEGLLAIKDKVEEVLDDSDIINNCVERFAEIYE